MTGSKTSWSIRAGQGLLFLFVNTHVAGAQWEQTPLCRRLSELRGSKCNKETDRPQAWGPGGCEDGHLSDQWPGSFQPLGTV